MTKKRIDNQLHVKCYLSPDDKQYIKDVAKKLRISESKYIRLSALNKPLPDKSKSLQVIEMAKLRADLARLGNLQRNLEKHQQLPLELQQGFKQCHMRLKDILNDTQK